MKLWVMITAIAACLFSTGCEQKPKNPVAEHGNAMIDAYQKSKTVRDTASLSTIQTAVQTFYAANGRYPQDLSEIKDILGAEYDPSVYAYNPENGSVSLKQ
jgi:outer membrane lipoprotein-sorting protein